MHLTISSVHALCKTVNLLHNSKKLNNAQCNYSTVDKELLSIAMTPCEFWSMLLSAELHIHTNHRNILKIETPHNADCNGSLMLMNMVLNYIM
jgi:hypothetical protein